MRATHLWRALLLASMCCATARAQEFPLQQEGQFLNPPNLMTQSDKILTGMTIGSVAGFPFSAGVEAESIHYNASGKVVTLRFQSKIYRDAKGRTRLEWNMKPVGETIEGGWFMIDIFDPTTRMSIRLQPAVKTASQWRVPAPGEAPEHVCKPSDLPDVDPKLFANLVVLAPKVAQDEVGKEVVDGMAVRHGREALTYPARAIGKNSLLDRVTDYWFSQELQFYVLVKRSGPGRSQNAIRLTNISRTEPDAALFAIPRGYTVSQPAVWDGDCKPKLLL
jgi:hypothetical protein